MKSLETLEISPATRQTLTESVLKSLRNAILARTLNPGQRIPEAQIAAKLGVSRAPVREALAALIQEGLVERDDRGVYVSQLTREDIDEISSVRLALEKLAVELVATSATKGDFDLLKDNIRRIGRAKAHAGASELDLEFHELLVRAARNKRLLHCWLSIQSQIRLLLNQMDEDDDEFPRHTAEAHQELLDLLLARDGKKAVALIERQLENTHQRVAAHYSTKSGGQGFT
jgi:DNA-binding GntR family transcriptional regulator